MSCSPITFNYYVYVSQLAPRQQICDLVFYLPRLFSGCPTLDMSNMGLHFCHSEVSSLLSPELVTPAFTQWLWGFSMIYSLYWSTNVLNWINYENTFTLDDIFFAWMVISVFPASFTSSMNLLPGSRQINLLKTSVLPHYLWCSYSHLRLWHCYSLSLSFPWPCPSWATPSQGLFIPMCPPWMVLSMASRLSGLSVSSWGLPTGIPFWSHSTLSSGSSLPSLKQK